VLFLFVGAFDKAKELFQRWSFSNKCLWRNQLMYVRAREHKRQNKINNILQSYLPGLSEHYQQLTLMLNYFKAKKVRNKIKSW